MRDVRGLRQEVREELDDIDDDDELVYIGARDSSAKVGMALIGRLLLAAIFAMSGIAKLTDLPGTIGHMTSAGIPYADTLAVVAGVAELAGAAALALGLLTRLGAFGLLLYLIPTTLMFHAFWNFHGAERLPQMVNFMKNLAIMGGLSTLVAFGASRASFDHRIRRARARRAARLGQLSRT
jgi:putative oxidoreductase